MCPLTKTELMKREEANLIEMVRKQPTGFTESSSRKKRIRQEKYDYVCADEEFTFKTMHALKKVFPEVDPCSLRQKIQAA
ncbi:hypothetical protein NDU88_004852 [Pleurodeles waltl]|uniref:Uncharacterized protein n=1 Tax=Pleurodeles waltl TaxID=8319 RepID=A0AAV7MYQ8_PLEWA|nr:hypothetical protein NDU88_004852 [Pleurodeles waltl]